MSEITINLPDGSHRSLPAGSTGADLAADIGPRLAKEAVVVEVGGEPRDLAAPLADGDQVRIVTTKDPDALEHLRHSTAHVLAQAVLEMWPGATFAGGPPIVDGFYYDFDLPDGATFSDSDLEAIAARMKAIVKENQPFVRDELPADEALALFADHPYKRVFIEAADGDEVAGGGTISTYRNTDSFVDLCRGPHVPRTGMLGHFALQRVAGAYFRGDEKNPMLQRIYGTAWASKQDLADHLERLEQAALRDHRKLGAELDLFSFPEEIGSGLAVFHPKGGIVRRLMEDYSRRRHEEAGYEFVYSPHITKAALFETSGHLDWFADGMFPPMHLDHDHGGEGTDYYLKPMNCPFHILIFRSRQRSYRELPLRMFEFGTVYRYEKSGVIHGLTRVRGMTQDDSHIYCTREQMRDELASLLRFVLDLLRDYGLDDFFLELSTKDPEKYVGSDEMWEEATETLREVAESSGLHLVPDPGGAAFYGPKISVQVRDALGRSWQMSTIQLDFNMPERFGLEYTASDGTRQRPVLIHRALFGSIERFFGILTEHYAGAFPAWLAPVQVVGIPVAEEHVSYLQDVARDLRVAGVRVEVDASDDRMAKKIVNHTNQKVPFMLLAGDRDVEAGAVSFRFADRSQINGVPREQAIAAIGNWIADRENAVPNADTMKVRGD
jgi:threonyl-tRNA synthetase